MSEPVLRLLAALAEPGQPGTLFAAIDEAAKALVGHRLFTLLHVDGDDVVRVYSNRLDEEPVGGRKPMRRSPWGKLVMDDRRPHLAQDMSGIRWAFANHERIEASGMGSAINIPVVYDGATIGSMNLLDAEYRYGPAQVALVAPLAPLLVPAMLQARAAAGVADGLAGARGHT